VLREFVLEGIYQSSIVVGDEEARVVGFALYQEVKLLKEPSKARFSLVVDDALEEG
jgi:hypothetical protein